MRQFIYLAFLVMVLLPAARLNAQRRDTLSRLPDTGTLASKMKAVAKFAEEKSSAELAADKTSIEQYRILEQLINTIQKAKTYLKSLGDSASSSHVITNAPGVCKVRDRFSMAAAYRIKRLVHRTS